MPVPADQPGADDNMYGEPKPGILILASGSSITGFGFNGKALVIDKYSDGS